MSFQEALAFVLRHEGGFVEDPQDPGGATNMGVTIGTLTQWRGGRPTSVDDVRRLSSDEVREIYRSLYWTPSKAYEMPAGVGLLVFDSAVNHGVRAAARLLQQSLKVAADGVIGPQTLAAVKRADPVALANEFCARRAVFYARLHHFERFGLGWMRRLADAHAAALRTLSIL